jgi:hypothetical protein
MSMALGWRDALQLAKDNLDRTPAAPAWLAQAVMAAQDVAPVLAPPPVRDEIAPEFFYPH